MGLDQWLNVYYDDDSNETFTYRKSNFLRGWMIRNTKLNADSDCEPVDVSTHLLEELYDECKEVLERHEKAEEILPTYPGFFFGTYDYDDWYFKQVKLVKEDVENILKRKKEISCMIYEDWW